MSQHFIEKCSCGAVLRQCRCFAPEKHKLVWIRIDACEACRPKVQAGECEGPAAVAPSAGCTQSMSTPYVSPWS